MGDFWAAIGYRPAIHGIPRSLNANLKDFRVKSGPNGQALITSHLDLQAMPQSLKDSLSILGGPKMKETIDLIGGKWVPPFLD